MLRGARRAGLRRAWWAAAEAGEGGEAEGGGRHQDLRSGWAAHTRVDAGGPTVAAPRIALPRPARRSSRRWRRTAAPAGRPGAQRARPPPPPPQEPPTRAVPGGVRTVWDIGGPRGEPRPLEFSARGVVLLSLLEGEALLMDAAAAGWGGLGDVEHERKLEGYTLVIDLALRQPAGGRRVAQQLAAAAAPTRRFRVKQPPPRAPRRRRAQHEPPPLRLGRHRHQRPAHDVPPRVRARPPSPARTAGGAAPAGRAQRPPRPPRRAGAVLPRPLRPDARSGQGLLLPPLWQHPPEAVLLLPGAHGVRLARHALPRHPGRVFRPPGTPNRLIIERLPPGFLDTKIEALRAEVVARGFPHLDLGAGSAFTEEFHGCFVTLKTHTAHGYESKRQRKLRCRLGQLARGLRRAAAGAARAKAGLPTWRRQATPARLQQRRQQATPSGQRIISCFGRMLLGIPAGAHERRRRTPQWRWPQG